jgi:acetylornithine deacetylase
MKRADVTSEFLRSRPVLERLIAFDTTSRLSNLSLIDWVREYLAAFGIDSRLTYDDTGAKANLFATIGNGDAPGIVLSGHTDVVPVDGQNWSVPPFQLTERDGRFYGRGTSDMKSFLAVALAYVPDFLAAHSATPIHLAFSYDEEVGCQGVPRLIADLVRRGMAPQACIVGEPTEMRVVTGHKGKIAMRGIATGLECHSSLAPTGVNAVEAAAGLITHLKDEARRRAKEGPFDSRFDPPYTTIQTGVVHGGTALNIVPGKCCFDFEFRTVPSEQPEKLQAEVALWSDTNLVPDMQKISDQTGIAFSRISSFPGLDTDDNAPVVALGKTLSGSNQTHRVPYGTEGGLFQQAGIPTIICGPGNIEQAHKPDEFIAIDQVRQCELFMERLVDQLRLTPLS